jgi:CheY-like chemotaxis protein
MWARRQGIQVPRILVADDNTNIQKMVALAFEERGIDVVCVGNGEAAVRRLPDLEPDLVLADVFMPVRNGYEVCEYVKKDERFSHVPVILLVGAFDPLDEKEARRVGADGVLKKPFVPPDPLIAMVTSALEKNPKLVAELAKAKEVAVELPPTPPAMEIPAKAEPKPLPEFPEPSPEEAAVIYGFGKGVRNLDTEEDQKDESKTAPVPVAEKAESAEEDFDGSSTTHDWRRAAAMNLNVPEEPGGKLAFASDEDFNPISFPSEQDVPPKRVRVPDASQEIEPATKFAAPPEGHVEATAPAVDCAPIPAPVLVEPPAQEPEPTPVPVKERKTQSWMDLLTTSPSEYPDGGWLTETHESSPESVAAENPTEAPALSVQAEAPPEVAPPAPVAHSETEEPFFADGPEAPNQWFAPPAPATTQESAPEPALTVASAQVPELLSEPSDEQVVSQKDPELEEPVAAHVNPEPLLVNDEPPRFGEYSSRTTETAALHSFFSPASGDPAVDQAPDSESEGLATANATMPETKPAETDDRIPTIPPPNREALAEIPFLNPPPVVATETSSASATDPATVDAMVEKLFERLEPQIHELLSQGVLRPLVENLLQQELAKKEK